MGALVDARDYCKLHIVEHYLAALLDLHGAATRAGWSPLAMWAQTLQVRR